MTTDRNKLKGIIPALVTPFDSQGNVNTDSLKQIIERNIAAGANGFYVCGSTGEAFLLTQEERTKVYKTVADCVDGRAALIAHVGCVSTRETIHFARVAEACGYDAISAVAPFYYKFSFDEIKRHYFSVVDNVSLPMIIYNVPVYSGISLSVAQVSEFFKDERFVGIKHTSNDYFALEQFKTAFPDKIVYNGYDEMCLSGLSMGADGAIGSTYNFMADKFIRIRKLFTEGNMEEALAVQKEANRFIQILIEVGVIPGVKEVLSQLGIPCGDCRPPFSVLTEKQRDYIRQEITDKLPR